MKYKEIRKECIKHIDCGEKCPYYKKECGYSISKWPFPPDVYYTEEDLKKAIILCRLKQL